MALFSRRSFSCLGLAPWLVLTGLLGCGSGGTGGEGGAGGAGGGEEKIVLPSGTSLILRVQDPAGEPIADASVRVIDHDKITLDAHTGEGGLLLLENLKPGRFVGLVQATGFAGATAVAELEDGQHGGAYVVLSPLGAPIEIDLDAESSVERDGVEVTIPAHSMVDSSGKPASGKGTVTLIPLDPAGGGLGAMPGPLEGHTVDGADPVSLESFFMAEISVWKDGEHLQLAEGKTAKVRFPFVNSSSSKYGPGDTIDAWSFNLNKGVWDKESQGVIEVSPDDPLKLTWVFEAPHFTWWNCDAVFGYQTTQCFQVTVTNGQSPLANQFVTAVGLSYNGTSMPQQTNGWGQACVTVKASSRVRLYNGYTSDPSFLPSGQFVDVFSPSYSASCASNPYACQPATIQVKPPQVCVPGSTTICTGGGTINTLGICRAPTQTCLPDGSGWGFCVAGVPPQPQETCGNWLDDNCNGQTDEGCLDECTLGQTRSCYTGPAGMQNVGICKAGVQNCVQTTAGRRWDLQCVGQVVPSSIEYCGNNTDDNCNGTEFECQCAVGTTAPCYSGPAGTQGVGLCKAGIKVCQQVYSGFGGSQWGACQGQVLPQAAEVCSTPGDDNCDGKANNPPFCCSVNADCASPSECSTAACSAGQCVVSPRPFGTPIAAQTAGDCTTVACDGFGGVLNRSEPTDVIEDNNACTKNVCNAQNPNPPEPAGTACNQSGGKVCDGAKKCVECAKNADCASNVCSGNTCVVISVNNCSNQMKNLGETDVDCGGICPSPCGNTKACGQDSDCASGNCAANVCKAADCSNGKQDGVETDADCGGVQCGPCPATKKCNSNPDCASGFCNVGICN